MWDEGSDRRFLRPTGRQARRTSRRSSGRGLVRRALRLTLVVAAAGGAAYGWGWLTTTPRLAVHEVAFLGLERTAPEALEPVRRALTGRNLLAIDLEPVQAALVAASPWVSGATVRRVPFHRVEIVLEEHRAVARLASGELVTAAGRRLPAEPRLPGDEALARIVSSAGAEPTPVTLARAAELLDVLGAGTRPLVARLRHVDVSDPGDLRVALLDAPYELHLGAGDFVARLNRFHNVEPVLAARYDGLRTVDLRYRGQVVVAPAGGPERMSPTSGG